MPAVCVCLKGVTSDTSTYTCWCRRRVVVTRQGRVLKHSSRISSSTIIISSGSSSSRHIVGPTTTSQWHYNTDIRRVHSSTSIENNFLFFLFFIFTCEVFLLSLDLSLVRNSFVQVNTTHESNIYTILLIIFCVCTTTLRCGEFSFARCGWVCLVFALRADYQSAKWCGLFAVANWIKFLEISQFSVCAVKC